MKKISELLPEAWLAPLSDAERSQLVTGVTSDSRQISPGSVFFAIRGGSQDGHRFIGQAQQQGAALVVGEEPAEGQPHLAPYIPVRDSRLALALAASAFHGHPSRSMKMVGVTG